jgi:hypothetical protein
MFDFKQRKDCRIRCNFLTLCLVELRILLNLPQVEQLLFLRPDVCAHDEELHQDVPKPSVSDWTKNSDFIFYNSVWCNTFKTKIFLLKYLLK